MLKLAKLTVPAFNVREQKVLNEGSIVDLELPIEHFKEIESLEHASLNGIEGQITKKRLSSDMSSANITLRSYEYEDAAKTKITKNYINEQIDNIIEYLADKISRRANYDSETDSFTYNFVETPIVDVLKALIKHKKTAGKEWYFKITRTELIFKKLGNKVKLKLKKEHIKNLSNLEEISEDIYTKFTVYGGEEEIYNPTDKDAWTENNAGNWKRERVAVSNQTDKKVGTYSIGIEDATDTKMLEATWDVYNATWEDYLDNERKVKRLAATVSGAYVKYFKSGFGGVCNLYGDLKFITYIKKPNAWATGEKLRLRIERGAYQGRYDIVFEPNQTRLVGHTQLNLGQTIATISWTLPVGKYIKVEVEIEGLNPERIIVKFDGGIYFDASFSSDWPGNRIWLLIDNSEFYFENMQILPVGLAKAGYKFTDHGYSSVIIPDDYKYIHLYVKSNHPRIISILVGTDLSNYYYYDIAVIKDIWQEIVLKLNVEEEGTLWQKEGFPDRKNICLIGVAFLLEEKVMRTLLVDGFYLFNRDIKTTVTGDIAKYGLREYPAVTDKTIRKPEHAKLLANILKEKFSQPRWTGAFETTFSVIKSLDIGDIINLDLGIIKKDFRIYEIVKNYKEKTALIGIEEPLTTIERELAEIKKIITETRNFGIIPTAKEI